MPTILFLCPHNAAKSVLAEAYFNQLMALQGEFVGISAGTEPDENIMPAVANLLVAEGLDISHIRPHVMTKEELTSAQLIVSMGCAIPEEFEAKTVHWRDIPPASQNLSDASATIYQYVKTLADALGHA